jgi:hypothetical protein
VWQAKPSLVGNINATEKLFTSTAQPKKSSQNCGGSGQKVPNNVFGWGLLKLYKAVNK